MGRGKTVNARRRIVTVRLADNEYNVLKELSNETGLTISELMRRTLLTVSIIYSDKLLAKRAFKVDEKILSKIFGEKRLHEVLKPLPELAKEIIKQRILENKTS